MYFYPSCASHVSVGVRPVAGGWWWDLRCRLRPPLASCSRPVGGSGGGEGTWGQGREAGTLSYGVELYNFDISTTPHPHLPSCIWGYIFISTGCHHNICLHPWKEDSRNTNKKMSRKQHQKASTMFQCSNTQCPNPQRWSLPNCLSKHHWSLSLQKNQMSFIYDKLFVFHCFVCLSL